MNIYVMIFLPIVLILFCNFIKWVTENNRDSVSAIIAIINTPIDLISFNITCSTVAIAQGKYGYLILFIINLSMYIVVKLIIDKIVDTYIKEEFINEKNKKYITIIYIVCFIFIVASAFTI